MIDLLTHHYPNGSQRNVLDYGFVRLVDLMPRIIEEKSGDPVTAEYAITQAARVSYGRGTKSVQEDRGLIRYLYRHLHTTPFEMIEFKFHCAMPLFVARQWIRHRTANVNEVSGRYSVIEDKFFYPTLDGVRQQSAKNKQCSEGSTAEGDASWFLQTLEQTCHQAYADYQTAIEKGIGREQARMILPVNIYTQWYWKCDLHNLLHFLKLRCDAHAQYEIRVFADAMLDLIRPLVPWSVEAWNDFNPYRDAVTLTALEVEALKDHFELTSDYGDSCACVPPLAARATKREQEEWVAKAGKLGFSVHP